MSTYDMGDECTFNIFDFDKSNNLSNLARFDKTHSKEKSLLPNEIRK